MLGDIIFFSLCSLVQITTSSAASLTDANVVLFSCVNLLWSRNLSGRQRRHLIFRLCASLNLSWFRALIYSNIWGRQTLSCVYYICIGREKHRPTDRIAHFDCQWFIFSAHPEINTHITLERDVNVFINTGCEVEKINDNSLQNIIRLVTPGKYFPCCSLMANKKLVLFLPLDLAINWNYIYSTASSYAPSQMWPLRATLSHGCWNCLQSGHFFVIARPELIHTATTLTCIKLKSGAWNLIRKYVGLRRRWNIFLYIYTLVIIVTFLHKFRELT